MAVLVLITSPQKTKDENTEIHRICGEEAQKETIKIKAHRYWAPLQYKSVSLQGQD